MRWRSLVEFLRLALRPIPKAHEVIELTFVVLFLLGLALAPPTWMSQWFNEYRWHLLLGVLAMLFLIAGVRLQTEARERQRALFDLTPAFAGSFQDIFIGGTHFQDNMALWVWVENDGPLADFVARIRDVRGVTLPQGREGQSYDVDEVAWEHTIDRSYTIPRGTRARLKVANVSSQPFALWFWTAASASYSPGAHAAGWRLHETEDTVAFDLIVTNVTADTELSREVVVTFNEDRAVVGFDLIDA